MRNIIPLTQFDYYHQIEEAQGNALVYYTSPACSSCRHLSRVLEQYLQDYNDLQVFVVDAGHEAGLVQTFEVFHLPSMFLYKAGKFHCQLQSEAHPVKLHEAIEKALMQAAEEEP